MHLELKLPKHMLKSDDMSAYKNIAEQDAARKKNKMESFKDVNDGEAEETGEKHEIRVAGRRQCI